MTFETWFLIFDVVLLAAAWWLNEDARQILRYAEEVLAQARQEGGK